MISLMNSNWKNNNLLNKIRHSKFRLFRKKRKKMIYYNNLKDSKLHNNLILIDNRELFQIKNRKIWIYKLNYLVKKIILKAG